jgi:hypothetical protein
VKVFRCQLPKDNEFYAAEEPKGCVGSQCSGGSFFAFSSTCFVLLSCISPSTKLAFEVVQADSYSAI